MESPILWNHESVTERPARWEGLVVALGAVALIVTVATSAWQLLRKGRRPTPVPFPNFDHRYLEAKYGRDGSRPHGKRPSFDESADRWYETGERRACATSPLRVLFLRHGYEAMDGSDGRARGPTPLSRSASADSVSSVSSVAPDFGFQDDGGGGEMGECDPRVEVAVQCGQGERGGGGGSELRLALLGARGSVDAAAAPWRVRLTLLGQSGATHLGDSAQISAADPPNSTVELDQEFSVTMEEGDLQQGRLHLSAVRCEGEAGVASGGHRGRSRESGDPGGRPPEAQLHLSELELHVAPFVSWLFLRKSGQAAERCGDIRLSLNYLPTAERLTVVVVKAQHLVWLGHKASADPYVKVYLLQGGRKMSKVRTAVRKDERSPVYNESFTFSVPRACLPNVSVRVTVAERAPGTGGRAEVVGHVVLGPRSRGAALAHWTAVLASPRRAVAAWHALIRGPPDESAEGAQGHPQQSGGQASIISNTDDLLC
ncbi:LOW QUALITY PROTEIN: synaptotagmin-12-like [Lethenteron reissneri]|uniref:LOW QUALITY PROTEIN: synaptotagmin-12-like n=1 Tax=Lethenteron reissneri TaxID=7753 RepID=UPI002AB644BE|nr:LOW QUALITY PROTEIN: synaptotagmin-12-like [Lethenteron reissneri]